MVKCALKSVRVTLLLVISHHLMFNRSIFLLNAEMLNLSAEHRVHPGKKKFICMWWRKLLISLQSEWWECAQTAQPSASGIFVCPSHRLFVSLSYVCSACILSGLICIVWLDAFHFCVVNCIWNVLLHEYRQSTAAIEPVSFCISLFLCYFHPPHSWNIILFYRSQ